MTAPADERTPRKEDTMDTSLIAQIAWVRHEGAIELHDNGPEGVAQMLSAILGSLELLQQALDRNEALEKGLNEIALMAESLCAPGQVVDKARKLLESR